ncbi:MAG: LLM class flavin-dependent oxidoreductase [Microbacterium gubbeenense]|uniref:LLM class flavin-dependent oxidoreductase n=1 Tax=Microbacterium gubbeenense TaxID=159896 RepID=UPI003F9A44C5
MTRISLGIAGSLGPEKAAEIAPYVEAAGFHALWINETQGINALEVAAAVAKETDRLVVATGVIAVDRRPASEILDDFARLEIPAERLVVGIGSGQKREGALARMEQTLADLRAATTARLAVGALGPKMRRLAAEHADAAVLSWLPPEEARAQSDELHARQPRGSAVLYARTSAVPEARARLEKEAAAYAELPAYARHFARLGIDPLDTVISSPEDRDRYRGTVDELVLRAVTPADRAGEYLDFLPLAH